MKIRNYLIFAGGLLFAWLFYRQGQGINYALFSLFIAACLIVFNPFSALHKSWRWCMLALAIACTGMVLHGSVLATFATIFTWLLLAAITAKPGSPAVVNFVQSGFSLLLSLPEFFKGMQEAAQKREGNPFSFAKSGFIYIIVMAIFILFLLLYSATSASFSRLLGNIDLSFINFGWVVCAIFGFFLTHGLLKHTRLKLLDETESISAKNLLASLYISPETENRMAVEQRAGILLLALLNLLLLVVNITDIEFIINRETYAAAINYPEMVHEGIGALIFSIIIAIAIIMYFFRGGLNFRKQAKPLVILALLWMAQNLILTTTGGVKNYLYIDNVDGLTYKRVGVFFYLLLSSIGLAFTVLKVYGKKPNWYLVRTNFIAFFIVMIVSSPFDWDIIITGYNIKHGEKRHNDPDINYLLTLSYRNLPQIARWVKEKDKDTRWQTDTFRKEYLDDVKTKLKIKSGALQERYEKSGWQGYNYAVSESYNYFHTSEEYNLEKRRQRDSVEAENYRAAEQRINDSIHSADSVRLAEAAKNAQPKVPHTQQSPVPNP